jgi:hypothetical protein
MPSIRTRENAYDSYGQPKHAPNYASPAPMPPAAPSYSPSGYTDPTPPIRLYPHSIPYDHQLYPKQPDYGSAAYSPTTSIRREGGPAETRSPGGQSQPMYGPQHGYEPSGGYPREPSKGAGRTGITASPSGDSYVRGNQGSGRYPRPQHSNETQSYVSTRAAAPPRRGVSPRAPPQPEHAGNFRTIEELYDHVWSGFITRNKKHRVGVDVYLAWGEIADLLTDYNLNISHRTALEEARRISSAVQGVVAFTSQNETQNQLFDSYIEYFASKQRVSSLSPTLGRAHQHQEWNAHLPAAALRNLSEVLRVAIQAHGRTVCEHRQDPKGRGRRLFPRRGPRLPQPSTRLSPTSSRQRQRVRPPTRH